MTRHLLHVGYPKTGSTFLQRWFESHPQLSYVEGGIGGFRDVYSIARNAACGTAAPLYRVTSAEALSAPRRDAGAATIDYARTEEVPVAAAQHEACATLAGLFPGAEVLIVTRGFRSMIVSSLSQYARSGGHLDPFELLRGVAARGDERFYQSWDYDALIGEYRLRFGEDRVIVMPYELLRDDAEAFVRTLSARLGVAEHRAPRDRVNESLSPSEMVWYPRLTRMVRRVRSRRLYEAYVRGAFDNRLRAAIAVLQRARPATPFTASAIPDEVLERFRGRAESLRGNPLYARYAADYLHG